jgi:shikimate kinase
MKVVLLGYMASGKSTVGRVLAKRLNYDFVDLDEEISQRVGMEIATIFSRKGEIFFRKKETEVLGDILQGPSNIVLALGGGTPCYGTNMSIINESTANSFYLKLSVPNLVVRLLAEKEQRPLVANISDDDLAEFVGKHLFERAPFYSQANHTIMTDDKTLDEVVNELRQFLV